MECPPQGGLFSIMVQLYNVFAKGTQVSYRGNHKMRYRQARHMRRLLISDGFNPNHIIIREHAPYQIPFLFWFPFGAKYWRD